MTRIHPKNNRAYINGVDVSGYARQVGALNWMFDVNPDATWTDAIKNIVLGQCTIEAGTLNAVLDNDAAGLFDLTSASTDTLNLMVAFGGVSAPVAGSPFFAWKFENTGYKVEPSEGFVSASVPFGGASYSGLLTYQKPYGVLLHPRGLEDDVNSSTGVDDNGASSAKGGILVYHLLSSDGTVTLKVQDAATNADGSFADLTGATSGSIDASVTPVSGMVGISTTATVRRYLRWQLEFGTATEANFVLGFIRNTI